MLDILEKYFPKTIQDNEQILKFIENIQILFIELTDETNFLYSKNQNIPFINDLLKHIQNCISSNQCPSILYGFFDAKFLSYLYNYSTQEFSIKTSSHIEGIQCPIDNQYDDKFQSFEILLLLCYQAIHDEQYISNRYLLKSCLNYQTNFYLLIRILDEKIYFYLEELLLPNPISYQYINKYLTFICLNNNNLIIRENDFEFISNIFSQLFRIYRRDIKIFQQFIYLFYLFLKKFYQIIKIKFIKNDNWIHLKKLIDAFWQMTINKNNLLNNQIRKSIIQIKQILINNEEILIEDVEKILNDSSYFVKLEGYKLCLNLFYQNQFHLKSSEEQKKIFQYFLSKNSLTILFVYYLSNISEYLSYETTFYLIKLGLENKISKNILQHILPNISIQLIIQYYHQQLSYQIKDFPWTFFNHINSIDMYNSFIFSTYFLSSKSDRQQLNSIFPDIKSSIIEYFPQLQANILPLLANKNKQAEENRQLMEKLITKNEYNRLIKQNLTMIIYHILLTYSNDQQNQFYDKWAPEPILPAYNWEIIKNTFDYLKQIINGKTFIDILIKLTVRNTQGEKQGILESCRIRQNLTESNGI